MKTYKDLPPSLLTKDGAEVFIHGYIDGAMVEAAQNERERMAERILNAAIKESFDLMGNRATIEWLQYAVKVLMEMNGMEETVDCSDEASYCSSCGCGKKETFFEKLDSVDEIIKEGESK